MKAKTIIGSVIILLLVGGLAFGAFVMFKRRDVRVVTDHEASQEVIETVTVKDESFGDAPGLDKRNEVIQRLVGDGFVFSTNPKTKEEVIKNLGEPLRVENKEYENRHNDDIDNIATLYYDGFEISFYEVAADGRQFMLHWVVDNRNYQLIYDLKVGVTEQFVFELLGEPSFIDGDYKVFEDVEDYGCLALKVQEGLVEEIVGKVYLD